MYHEERERVCTLHTSIPVIIINIKARIFLLEKDQKSEGHPFFFLYEYAYRLLSETNQKGNYGELQRDWTINKIFSHVCQSREALKRP